MTRYTAEHCLQRASNLLSDWDGGRIIREHQEHVERTSDPDEARIAIGFAIIARRRRLDEIWRATQYKRLARGEDLTATPERSPIVRLRLGVEDALDTLIEAGQVACEDDDGWRARAVNQLIAGRDGTR